jgi:hypothetical protein
LLDAIDFLGRHWSYPTRVLFTSSKSTALVEYDQGHPIGGQVIMIMSTRNCCPLFPLLILGGCAHQREAVAPRAPVAMRDSAVSVQAPFVNVQIGKAKATRTASGDLDDDRDDEYEDDERDDAED